MSKLFKISLNKLLNHLEIIIVINHPFAIPLFKIFFALYFNFLFWIISFFYWAYRFELVFLRFYRTLLFILEIHISLYYRVLNIEFLNWFRWFLDFDFLDWLIFINDWAFVLCLIKFNKLFIIDFDKLVFFEYISKL